MSQVSDDGVIVELKIVLNVKPEPKKIQAATIYPVSDANINGVGYAQGNIKVDTINRFLVLAWAYNNLKFRCLD